MSSQCVAVDPNDPRLTTYQDPPEPPFKTPYTRRLHAHGLTRKAWRAHEDGKSWRHYKDEDGATWRLSCSSSMLRTNHRHALRLAEDQEHDYRVFHALIHQFFARIDIRFTVDGTAPDFQRKLDILYRELKHVPPAPVLSKTHTTDARTILVRAIVATSLDGQQLQRLRSALPGYSITRTNHCVSEFFFELRAMLQPVLPRYDSAALADFEWYLSGVHQVALHQISRKELAKFVYKALNTPYTNLSDDERRKAAETAKKTAIRNPHTGKIALWRSSPVAADVTIDKISPSDWEWIGPPELLSP